MQLHVNPLSAVRNPKVFDARAYDRASRRIRAGGTSAGVIGTTAAASSAAAFNGDFSSFFAGMLLYVQPDRSITEASTLLDVGGGGPVVTLTGTRTGAPVPLWIKAATGGARGTWTFNTYADASGTTPIMSGVLSAATVNLTGVHTGLVANIAAGTATINNFWKTRAAQTNDFSGGAFHLADAGNVNASPLITLGPNNKTSLSSDGVQNFLYNASLNLPAPGTTPINWYWLGKILATPGSNGYWFNAASGGGIRMPSTGGIDQYNGTVGNATALAVGTRKRMRAKFQNSAADFLQVGSTNTTGTNTGNLDAGAGFAIMNAVGGGAPTSLELSLLIGYTGAADIAGADAAANAYFAGIYN